MTREPQENTSFQDGGEGEKCGERSGKEGDYLSCVKVRICKISLHSFCRINRSNDACLCLLVSVTFTPFVS